MVRVKIDGRYCDLMRDFVLPESVYTFDEKSLRSPQKARTGRRVEVVIPSSPTNDSIVQFAADPYVAERFNASYHEGIIEVDGVALLTGVAHLESVESAPQGVAGECRAVCYRISIRGGAAEWAKRAAERGIEQTKLDYSELLDGDVIERSWETESAVKFLPVFRDEYLMSADQSSLYTPQRVLSVGDYHPFISIETLMRSIFTESGYEVRSNFMQSDMLRSLHLSGCIDGSTTASAARLTTLTGFLAGRREEATATANFAGRVYLSPLVLTNSLGNFVQTTDKSVDEAFYNNGNALSITDEGVVYTPRTKVTAAFDIYLKYTTQCRILTRERLQGFDKIYVDTGCQMQFNIANPYRDHREEIVGGVEYTALIFDFAEGERYRIKWLLSSGYSYGYLSSRAAKITAPSSAVGAQLMKQSTTGSWAVTSQDWALYDGYVEEQGEHQVEVTLRTPPEELSPSKSKSFVRMYIEGAESGQSITLSKECRLQPLFGSSLGYGSQVDGQKVLQHGFSQADLVEAVQQMFNLRIVTHNPSRTVWIEPRDEFYRDECYDWSERVVLSDPIVAVDMAADVASVRTLEYRGEGGGAVTRYNTKEATQVGQWSAATDSYISIDKRERGENPLFCPTLSQTDIVADAASAALVSVGDRDADELAESAIRVVSYRGLQPLPAGERWGFPSDGDAYPFAAFHYVAGASEQSGAAMVGDSVAAGPEESFTLCFEDRDGVEGLHRFYDRQWACEQSRRRLTLSIRITPDELLALDDFDVEGADMCSLYRLEFSSQAMYYRLVAVEGYDARRGVARMTFARESHD